MLGGKLGFVGAGIVDDNASGRGGKRNGGTSTSSILLPGIIQRRRERRRIGLARRGKLEQGHSRSRNVR